MAPKKAGKKAAKKVAKKAAKKAPGQRRAHDLRRCYEHFGRVAALLPLLAEPVEVARMGSLAQELLRAGELKGAADVLRAAEHLSFGSLAANSPQEELTPTLATALEDEYRHLLERADHHAADLPSGAVLRFFTLLRKQAASAFRAKHLRAASELARGAEALSHITAEVNARLRPADLDALQTSLALGELP